MLLLVVVVAAAVFHFDVTDYLVGFFVAIFFDVVAADQAASPRQSLVIVYVLVAAKVDFLILPGGKQLKRQHEG